MRFRPVARVFFFLWVASFFVLMWAGAKPAEQPYVLISQLATAYYFLWFLVLLPVLGRLERPLPLPESIAAAVLGPRAMTPMGAGPLPGGLAPAKPMDKA
jgi:ubiquinol-cytochrome c reductase cytochrome b subunit